MRLFRGISNLFRSKAAETAVVSEWIGPGRYGLMEGVSAGDPKAYSINAWVFTCVNAIAQAVASAPIVVQQRKRDEWQVNETHPLAELLDYVNNEDDQFSLLEQTAAWTALFGNSNWRLMRPRENALPMALQVLIANNCEPKPGRGKRSALIEYWEYSTGGGQKVRIDDIDMVHIKRFNPMGGLVGLAPIRVIEHEINAYTHSNSFNDAFFKGGGVPTSILTSDRPLTREDIARYNALWHEWRAQSADAQVPLKLGRGLQLQTPGQPPNSVVVTELPRQLRETICAVFEVPPAIVGLFEYANYANAQMQERIFYRRTISQYWRRIESAVNEQLAPQYGDDVRIRFDRAQVAALQPDYQELAAAAAQLTGGEKVLTADEARQMLFQLQPFDAGTPARWGPWTNMPQAGGDGKPLDGVGGTTESEMDRSRSVARKHHKHGAKSQRTWRRLTDSQRKTLYGKFNRRRDAEIRQIQKTVATWYDGLLEIVIDNIDAADKAGLVTGIKAPSITSLLFSSRDATRALQEAMGPVIADILAATGQEAIEQVTTEIAFDVDTSAMQQVLRSRTVAMRSVSETAQDRLRNSLADGLADGETIEQLTARAKQWAKQGKENHALTVARTESGTAMNAAALEGYSQGGADGKEWLAINDDRTRDSHAELDGTVIGINETFDVGGYPAQQPGDTSLPIEEIASCRCAIAPAVSV